MPSRSAGTASIRTVSNVGSIVVNVCSAGALLLWAAIVASAAQGPDDPTVRAAVERYYKALEAEDMAAYLALWSPAAERPRPESLKFLFESGDERFYDIEIVRVVAVGDRLRVRVKLRRERTRPPRVPGGPPIVQTSLTPAALTFVKEADDWKIVSEGLPADDLAAAVAAAATAEQRDALLAAEPDLVDTTLLSALGRIATSAAAVQRYARAQYLYERILELARKIGSKREEGEALQNLGNMLFFHRRFAEALAAYEERRALEEQRADDLAMASALVGVATVKYSLAEYSEALKPYRLALAIQERLDDRYATAMTLIGTANVRYLQADYSGAIRDYSRSRDLYRAMGDPSGAARALEGLGRTYSVQGDYASALSAFAGVLAEGRARADRARQATANQSIAEVHLRLGNIDAARKHYQESRDHFSALNDRSGAGRVWQGLGMTELMAGRFDAAEQAYVRSMTTCTGAQDHECSAHAVVGLAFAQFAQEKFSEAVSSYRKAVDAFTALRGREPAARAEVGLSQALAGANDLPAALEAAARGRTAAIALEHDDVLWRALTAEARVLRKTGALDKAIAAARAATAVVERMHEAALQKPATTIPSDASSAFATLAVLEANAGDPAAAWSSASRMRALDLRAALAVNERDIARGMTPEERDRERAMSSEVLSLLAQRARERALSKPDAARLADLEQRIASASASRATAMDELYARLPELRIWRALAPSPMEQLPAILPSGTIVLDFVVDDEDVLLVVVSSTAEQGISAYPTAIRRRALAERVNALLRVETLRDPLVWRKAASELVPLLPPQAMASVAAASRVIVVPHDVIWRVPFEALPVGDGCLGDRVQISYAGSAAALVHAAKIEPSSVGALLAVSAPELLAATTERLQQTAPGWALRRGDAAEREMTASARVYEKSATVLAGPGATEAAVRTGATTASRGTALHVAAPFRINGASPLFSPVLLSGNASSLTNEDDGTLETREVMNLNIAARVAILSDGAATSMRDGASAADVVQWGWLAAGVPSLVLARWSADAAASDALLAEFHRRLLKGAEPGAALQAARTAIRQRPEWAAPYFWAGWIVLGK